MSEVSRTGKTIRNTIFNLVNQMISIILQFVLRTVFIRCLALEYLGLNGLFTNILTMLSLTELGLGTAIVCNLYKPLAEKDEPKIIKYFQIYKKLYAVIGSVILVIGLLIIPFLDYLVKDAPDIPGLNVIYVLFLVDSVASYFFAHYRSLLGADQKDYINANNRSFFLVIQISAQITALYLFHDYVIYMLIKICCNLLSGFVVAQKTKKLYPFIKNKTFAVLSKTEKQNVLRDSAGVFTTKIGMTVLNSTDNIIISSFIGSIVTAYYSNYSLIVGTVSTAMGLIFSSVQASIGNYCILSGKDESRKMLLNMHYIYFCIYGFSAICLGTLLSPFIQIWLGKDFLLAEGVVIAIVLKFYLSNVRQIVLNFLTVMHLLVCLNLKTIIETILNIALSIYLVLQIGIIGIFVGTCVSMLLTSLWYEPFVLYRKYLGKGLLRYYMETLKHLIVMGAGYAVAVQIRNFFFTGTFMSFFLVCITTAFTAAAVVCLPFIRSQEFLYMKGIVGRLKEKRFTC